MVLDYSWALPINARNILSPFRMRSGRSYIFATGRRIMPSTAVQIILPARCTAMVGDASISWIVFIVFLRSEATLRLPGALGW